MTAMFRVWYWKRDFCNTTYERTGPPMVIAVANTMEKAKHVAVSHFLKTSDLMGEYAKQLLESLELECAYDNTGSAVMGHASRR